MGRSYWMYFWNVFSKFSFVEQRQYAQHCYGPTWGMVAMSAAAAAKSLQSCLTLCDPVDGSPPGSPIPGILQARTLEWVAIFFSNAWKWKVKVKSLSRVRPSATPWTAAFQAPPSMGFSRQEYWSGVPLPFSLKKGYNSKPATSIFPGQDCKGNWGKVR